MRSIVASVLESSAPSGPWQRKKAQSMQAIQRAALALFEEHGYGNVTVERVAAEASVSPSSIYRYFGTKEMLVLHDEYDQQFVELLQGGDEVARMDPDTMMRFVRAAAAGLIAAAVQDEDRIRQRMSYVATEPDIKLGFTRQAQDIEDAIRSAAAARLGRSENDLELRVAIAGVVWGFYAAITGWVDSGYADALDVLLDNAIDQIVRGARAQFGLAPD